MICMPFHWALCESVHLLLLLPVEFLRTGEIDDWTYSGARATSVFQYLFLVPSIITFGVSSLGAFVTNLVRNGVIILICIMKSCAEPYKWKRSVAETWAGMADSPCAGKGLHPLFLFSREESTVTTRAISEETRPHLLHCQHAMDFSKCPNFCVCSPCVQSLVFFIFKAL